MNGPTKIYYVATSTVPSRAAHSIHEVRMCRDFAALGMKVTMFVEGNGARAGEDALDIHEHYGVARTFGIRRIPLGSGRLKFLRYLSTFEKILRDDRPDFVYGCNAFGIYAAARAGIPCAMEMHTPPSVHTGLSRFFIALAARSSHFKGSVFNTNALREIVARETPVLARKKMLALHNGSDDPSDLHPVTLNGDRGNLRVGYIGHLYPGKGMERIADIARGMGDIDVHVFGGTPEDVARWKRELDGAGAIFHGHVAPADAYSYQRAMDILLAPYQKNIGVSGGGKMDIGEYISPMKLFEYMAAGKAVICSDLPILREIVDEEIAVLVPPTDGDAWIRAIERLRDPALREKLGRKARERFLERYTRSQRAKKIAETFGWSAASG